MDAKKTTKEPSRSQDALQMKPALLHCTEPSLLVMVGENSICSPVQMAKTCTAKSKHRRLIGSNANFKIIGESPFRTMYAHAIEAGWGKQINDSHTNVA